MYKISVLGNFSSAHALRGYKGKCENLHGHNWKVKVNISGKKLGPLGMLVDFTDLRAMLAEVLAVLDHKYINEAIPFSKTNPTAENISRYIFIQMKSKMKAIRNAGISSVIVWESEGSSAEYSR